MSAPVVYVGPGPCERAQSFCDALEWLLVAFGHRHVGKVRASTLSAGAVIIWSNRPMPASSLVIDAPEADLRCSFDHQTQVPVYQCGGSVEWAARATMVCRVCIELAVLGWAVQRIDDDGVLVARFP